MYFMGGSRMSEITYAGKGRCGYLARSKFSRHGGSLSPLSTFPKELDILILWPFENISADTY